jgi:hypothetical protein
MLAPSCEHCGCALETAVARDESSAGSAATWSLPPSALPVLRALGVVVALLGLYAAAKVGYHAAGASGGMVAFGVGGFLLLPFVPQQVGGAPR